MNRNLDVWAIQKYPNELYTALENVKTDTGDLILFTNLECDFELNGQAVKRSFDTSLYYDAGNGNDALILLMKDGIATADQIREYLEKKQLRYHEVSFAKDLTKELPEDFENVYKEEKDDENIPELWFAREEYVLRDALNDSIEQGNTTCDYYPLLQGFLSLNYRANSDLSSCDVDGRNLNGSATSILSSYSVDGRKILGVIALEDKMILLINNGNDTRNISPFQAHKIMEELGVSANVHSDSEFNIERPYQGKMMEKKVNHE